MMRIQKFVAELGRGLIQLREAPRHLKHWWELIVLLALFLGKVLPDNFPNWFGEVAPVFSYWSGFGLVGFLAWWMGMAWERSRHPKVCLDDPVPDRKQKRFDLLVGSTEDDKIAAAAYVTKVVKVAGGLKIDEGRVRLDVELCWRELPSIRGAKALVSRLQPQYCGFLIVESGSEGKVMLYLDGTGGKLPLYDTVNPKKQDRIEITVVVLFFDDSRKQLAAMRRLCSVIPSEEAEMFYEVSLVKGWLG